MVPVPLHQSHQEFLRETFDVLVIEAEARKASRRARPGNAAPRDRIVAALEARMRVALEHPFRGRGHQLGDHDPDAVLRREVHHAVVVAPIVFPGRDLDRRPHEPVPECVRPQTGGGLMIPGPIRFGWVGFAKVDRSVWEYRVRSRQHQRAEKQRQGRCTEPCSSFQHGASVHPDD